MSKNKRTYRDPHAEREKEKYEKPVASRELILKVLEDVGRPQTREQLEPLLEIDDEDAREGLRRRLRAMLRDGQVVETRSGQYGLAEKMDLIAGRVQGHRDGFGFLVPDSKNGKAGKGGNKEEDLFLSPRQMRAVLDGDRVLASAEGRNRFGKREGRIVQVTERATTEVVGRYYQEAGIHFIEPANRRIARDVLITEMNGISVQPGDHVRAEIIRFSAHEPNLLVRLLEVVASPDEPGMEVDVALRSYSIPHEWPKEVSKEAAAISEELPPEASAGKVDLRKLPLVTIDDESARDFDDAILVEKRWRGGWRLVVAIADVSHYVPVSSALDQEGHRRGTSVYFPNRVVPMLPEKLSNGLCSLNPDVDRLCLFCEMQVSAAGRITKFSFGEGVMRSRHRLTYNKVGALIEQPDSELANQVRDSLDKQTLDMLGHYHNLYKALRKQREIRGAIDFDTVETRIIYDDQKKIRAIEPVKRNVAHMMIEEAMLAANICTARLLEKSKLPTLFRNHQAPTAEKLTSLQEFLGGVGLSIPWSEKDGDPSPAVFQSLTEQIAGRSDRLLIQTVMLRSLTQARYEPENKGHFGLAYKAYAHFTSPIRRYPDLLVHRALRYLIRSKGWKEHVQNPGKLKPIEREQILPYSDAQMVELGEHCSFTERRADEATRDVEQWLKCQYMEQHLGDEFEGIIAGVTGFGIFVQLNDLYIEGLVHVSSLDSDYYHHDQPNHQLVGESSGRVFRLGDTVRVQVAAVHTEDRKVDLQLVSGGESGKGGRKGGAGKGKGGPARRALAEGKTGKGGAQSEGKGRGGRGRGRGAGAAGKPKGKGKDGGGDKAAPKKKAAEKDKDAPAKKKSSGGRRRRR